MPATRKPTEVLELNGAFTHNPKRKRPTSPKSHYAIGHPPKYLSADEIRIWHELIANSPDGVLTATDAPVLEIVVRLLAKFRQSWLPAPELAQLTTNLARMGWTPADRSRITAVQAEAKAEFDFLQ